MGLGLAAMLDLIALLRQNRNFWEVGEATVRLRVGANLTKRLCRNKPVLSARAETDRRLMVMT